MSTVFGHRGFLYASDHSFRFAPRPLSAVVHPADRSLTLRPPLRRLYARAYLLSEKRPCWFLVRRDQAPAWLSPCVIKSNRSKRCCFFTLITCFADEKLLLKSHSRWSITLVWKHEVCRSSFSLQLKHWRILSVYWPWFCGWCNIETRSSVYFYESWRC